MNGYNAKWNFRKKTNEQNKKDPKNPDFTYIEQTSGCQRGGGWNR